MSRQHDARLGKAQDSLALPGCHLPITNPAWPWASDLTPQASATTSVNRRPPVTVPASEVRQEYWRREWWLQQCWSRSQRSQQQHACKGAFCTSRRQQVAQIGMSDGTLPAGSPSPRCLSGFHRGDVALPKMCELFLSFY